MGRHSAPPPIGLLAFTMAVVGVMAGFAVTWKWWWH